MSAPTKEEAILALMRQDMELDQIVSILREHTGSMEHLERFAAVAHVLSERNLLAITVTAFSAVTRLVELELKARASSS